MTGIEWTDTTWNPTSGCDRVSLGCDNCYALGMAKRLKAMGQPGYQNDGDPRTSGPGFALTLHPERLVLPLSWRKPRKVFVDSMSDLFHTDVPDEFIARVWAVMSLAPQHTFQILTKRHARLRSLLTRPDFAAMVTQALLDDPMFSRPGSPWPVPKGGLVLPLPNVHLGVSVEDQQWADIRIPALLETPATVRWISAEPLLGPVDLSRFLGMTALGFLEFLGHPVTPDPRLDWVVVGGESGRGARPMRAEWAQSIRDQCAAAGVPLLLKQWGAWVAPDQMPEDTWRRWEAHHAGEDQTKPVRVGKRAAGRLLDGEPLDGYPAVTA